MASDTAGGGAVGNCLPPELVLPRLRRSEASATTTKTGLQVHCELDPRAYPKGIKVSDAEMDTLNIRGNPFHPEWNYTIAPRVPP